jgi:hypothetical protein
MKRVDLDKMLKSVPVPERSEEYWQEFPDRVIAGLQAKQSRRRVERWQPRLAWVFAIACVLVFVSGLALRHWRGSGLDNESSALLQNEKIVREVLTFFPNRVRAIEQSEQGMQLVLSDKPDVPASTPLWIRICDGRQCRVVVTFSGQDLQIAGEKVEVLADAQGRVMLVGDRLFWSESETGFASGHLRIQARALAYAM